MHRTQMKGILVDEENICESCLSPVLPSGKVVRRGKEISKYVLIMSGIFFFNFFFLY
uniref:VPS41 subunit of HOPS complex n=1 Tax=Molossus molossus TaxID=27622 RepID=A0A7J8HE09_MOLMO|nr:VPS41 subunit of HOPS complex [Molossus molossus]